jgi:serine/threonine kinase PknH
MGLFVSYSSRDGAALAPVTAALRRAHLDAWLDEELTGGEAWWNAILEQIRSCEVFIAALSKNYLESKPCQAELRYAQELGRPILPVQIGQLDSMRVNPLASVQVIDYQNPTIDTGIELIAAVHARRANVPPLPSPLPEPPPVPFAYLLRLNNTIVAPELTAAEQAQLFSDLKAGLESDGNEPSARRDLIQLLIKLRDRPDITWKIRTDVEAVLNSANAGESAPASRPPDTGRAPTVDYPPQPSGWTGPQPVFSPGPPPAAAPSYLTGPPHGTQPPIPPYGPPHTGARPRRSLKPWLIAGAAVVATIAVLAVVGSLTEPKPPPPPKPVTVSAGQLNSILLTPAQINTIMGASHMEASDVIQKMVDEPAAVSPRNCVGALETGQAAIYTNSGWSGVSDQSLQQKSTVPNSDIGHFYVDQTAVVFPSADKAQAFLASSADTWKGCAGPPVTVNSGNGPASWTLGDLKQTDSKIVQARTEEGGGNWGCQHALSTVSNLVVEVVACSVQINDQASQIADAMIANLPHSQ